MNSYFAKLNNHKLKFEDYNFEASLKLASLMFNCDKVIISILDKDYLFTHFCYGIKPNETVKDFEKSLNSIIKNQAIDTDSLQLYHSEHFSYSFLLNKKNEILGTICFFGTNKEIETQLLNQFLLHISEYFELNLIAKKSLDSQYEMANMLGAIYECTNEACTYINKNLKIVYSNKIAKQLCFQIFGREPKPNDNSIDFMLPQFHAEFMDYYHRVLNHERIEVEKTNGAGWWKFIIFPVYDLDNNMLGIAHNVQDITTQKLNEIEICNQNEQLKKIAWQQSHEVRKPVSTILGLINLIESKKENDITLELEYLKQAATELDNVIHEIVNNSVM